MIDNESTVDAQFKRVTDANGRFLIQHVEYSNGTSVKEVLEMLTQAYDQIGKDLGIYPARTVNVKIYTPGDFSKISKLPEWAIGILMVRCVLKSTRYKAHQAR